MNNYYYAMKQKNAFVACENSTTTSTSTAVVAVDRRHPVFCPKPRRLTQLSGAAEPFRPLHWRSSSANYQADSSSDSKAGTDLLEIFLNKGGELNQVASSPPFFCGSPPTRSANPVVHDARFGEDRPILPFCPTPVISQGSSPMSPSARKSCAPTKSGLKPAAVRIEGFNCDRRSRSITAVA